jgi:hypothetical protein
VAARCAQVAPKWAALPDQVRDVTAILLTQPESLSTPTPDSNETVDRQERKRQTHPSKQVQLDVANWWEGVVTFE